MHVNVQNYLSNQNFQNSLLNQNINNIKSEGWESNEVTVNPDTTLSDNRNNKYLIITSVGPNGESINIEETP